MIVTVLAKFLYLFAASMCLGLAFGLGTSFLMKTFRSNSVPQARAGAAGVERAQSKQPIAAY